MKIVIFMEDYYLGGVDTFVINLINAWPDESDAITLICNHQHSGLPFLRASITRPCNIRTHRVPVFTSFFELTGHKNASSRLMSVFFRLLSPLLRYMFLIYDIYALKNVLGRDEPDRLLIVNGGYPGGDSCRAAAISWGMFMRKPRSLISIHGNAFVSGWHLRIQEYITTRIMCSLTGKIICVSNAVADNLRRAGGIDAAAVSTIYNGIQENHNIPDPGFKARFCSELGISRQSRLCVMLGAYHVHRNFDKGYLFIIDVFKRVVRNVPGAHLVICGYGHESDIRRIQSAVDEQGLRDFIHLLPFRADAQQIVAISDLALIASQTFESFCLVSIEAWAHKVPVVATCVGGIPEVVKDGQGGYCVNISDKEEYARHVIRFLNNESFRQEQGELGYKRYNRFFTAVKMSRDYKNALDQPLFSVIIPTYNSAAVLRRALNSVAGQTCRDFEVIVCDDGSTDNTASVVDEFTPLMNIRYLPGKNWGGPAVPRNRGALAGGGTYLAFLDSDDSWYPNKLAVIRNKLRDGDIFYHDLDISASNGTVYTKKVKGRALRTPVFVDLMVNENTLITSSVVVKKEVFLSAGGFPEEIGGVKMTCVEDFDLWLRIARITPRFVYVARSLGTYDAGSNTNVSAASPALLERLKIVYERNQPFLDDHSRLQSSYMLDYLTARTYQKMGLYAQARVMFESSRLARNLRIKVRSLAWCFYLSKVANA
jgi:L-malate glycosyltransferase